jgi:hypothetical protein
VEEGFRYETELVDHISGPAHHASGSLAELAGAAFHVEERLKSMAESVASGELFAKGIEKLTEFASEALKSAVEMAVEGVKFAAEMREFKEDAILAYSVVQGTAEEGERTFEAIDQLGRNVHMPAEKAHDLAQQLMTQGLENVQEVENVISAVSDLTRTGNERGAAKLSALVERSLAAGTFQVKGKQLAGTGLALPAVMEELAAELHRPVDQIKAEMKAGQISAEQGIVAIENAFAKSKVHEIASHKFTLKDITTDWNNSIRGLFQDVNTEPLMQSLFNMSYAFGEASKQGGGLKGVVTDVFNWIIRGVSPVIDAITELGLEFEIGYLKARIQAQPLLDELAQMGLHIGDIDSLGQAAEELAYGMTHAAIATVYLLAKLEQFREWMDNAKPIATVGGHEVGTGFVGGLIDGITGGTFGAVKAATGLMRALIDAVKDKVQVHSPSRVTEEIGQNLTQGLTIGIGKEDGHVAEAMGKSVSKGDQDIARAMGDSIDMGSVGRVANDNGARNVTIHPGAISVEVHAPHAMATAEEIRAITESAMEDVMERIVTELGG